MCGGVLVWCGGLVGGGVLLPEALLYCWRELCESGVAGGEFLLLLFWGDGLFFFLCLLCLDGLFFLLRLLPWGGLFFLLCLSCLGGGVLLPEVLLPRGGEVCEAGVAGSEFLLLLCLLLWGGGRLFLLLFWGGGRLCEFGALVVYFLCKGVRVRPGVVGNLFLVFFRVENDVCFPASDAGSEPGTVTENHSHVQVMMSLPGFLGLAGFFVEAGESCFVLAADGGVDRRVAPDDFAGDELVGALEGLIGFMQCRQGLHRRRPRRPKAT